MNKKIIYRILSPLIFSSIVILTFYVLHKLIPEKVLMHNELVTLIFIGISVLILFPARDRILNYLLKGENYSSLPNRSLSASGFAKRYLNIESLIHDDFPDFTNRLQLSASSLAILEGGRKFYRIYHYRKKKIIANDILDRKSCDTLCHLLAKNPQGVYADHKITPEAISEEIEAQIKNLNARVIHPLLYHKAVLGFLVFCDIPRGAQAKEFVEIFRYKATLSVQNHILSQRVIDNRVYDQEFAVASRIQKALENNTEPQIQNYKVQLLDSNLSLMSEFFMLNKSRWLFALMICKPFTGSAGILVYSLIGQLYSLIHLQKRVSLRKLFHSVKSSADRQSADNPIKLLFMELDEKTKKISFLTEEKNFRVEKYKNLSKIRREQKHVISSHGIVKLEAQASIELSYQEIPILRISEKGEAKPKNKGKTVRLALSS